MALRKSLTLIACCVLMGCSNTWAQNIRIRPQPPENVDEDKDKKIPEELQGVYLVEGSAFGKPYKGLALITKKKTVYQIEWRIGAQTFVGVGLRRGNIMSATWAIAKDGKVSAGALLFRIEPGPKLNGEWTGLPSDGEVHQETLTFVKKLGE